MMPPKIRRVEAFYKNDKPGGLGIIYEFKDGGERFVAGLERAMETWDANADPQDLLNQLDELGARREHVSLTDEENWVSLMNICWLELRGHLKPDRFNGAIFLPDGTQAAVRDAQTCDAHPNQRRQTPASDRGLHRSLDLLHLINRAHPEVWLAYDVARTSRIWPDYVFVPRDVTLELMKKVGIEDDLYKTDILSAMAAWRPTQGIYRFAPALLDALLETSVTGAIPAEVLHRIPEWCVYLEVEREVHGHQLHGAWAHLDINNRGDEVLRLVISYGADCLLFSVPLTDTIDASLATSIVMPHPSSVVASAADPRAHCKEMIEPVVSLLLYVCSTNSAILDPKTPSHTPSCPKPHIDKHGRSRWYAAQQATIWETGTRLGAALDAAKARSRSTESSPTGRTVRPHVRRAHWHGAWIGPRDDPKKRQFKLNWWSPVLVGYDEGGEPEAATIRPVEGKKP
jgi:hypothetical protein